MLSKRLVCPAQVRRVPKQFSWVDQRLVRDTMLSAVMPMPWRAICFWSPWLTIRD
jgi:hypothetical protein